MLTESAVDFMVRILYISPGRRTFEGGMVIALSRDRRWGGTNVLERFVFADPPSHPS